MKTMPSVKSGMISPLVSLRFQRLTDEIGWVDFAFNKEEVIELAPLNRKAFPTKSLAPRQKFLCV
jgi:hypothetical protein